MAELVLQKLEKITLIQHEPVFWRRYTDGTFVTRKKDVLQNFHNWLNAVFSDVTFTREGEREQQSPLLDVLVRPNPNGGRETMVCAKDVSKTTEFIAAEPAVRNTYRPEITKRNKPRECPSRETSAVFRPDRQDMSQWLDDSEFIFGELDDQLTRLRRSTSHLNWLAAGVIMLEMVIVVLSVLHSGAQ
ncbi:hypothetical protein SprV_0702428800 [Sparganum proliferum]